MKPGDVIRTRNIRSYMGDGRSFVEFKVDDERKREKQGAFVLVLIGVEPMVQTDDTKSINPNDWLKERGWTPPPEEPPNWDGIPPETRHAAKISKKVHEAGENVRSNIGGTDFSDVWIGAKDLKCNGIQLRGIGAKKYRERLERALGNVGLNLGGVSFEKRGRQSGILLTVS